MTEDDIDLLRRAGALLYGPAWQAELARALGIKERTVQRWAAGSRELPEEVWSELTELLFEHRDDLATVLGELASRQEGGA